MKKLSMILVALVLSACGSGSSDPVVGELTPTPPPMPTNPTVDAFFTRVNGFASTTSETEEPGDITLVTMTEPEASEPETL